MAEIAVVAEIARAKGKQRGGEKVRKRSIYSFGEKGGFGGLQMPAGESIRRGGGSGGVTRATRGGLT